MYLDENRGGLDKNNYIQVLTENLQTLFMLTF